MLASKPASPLTLSLYLGSKNRQERPITDLVYLQSDTNYTWLIWQNGERLLLPWTLKYFEAKLPAGQFVRLHRRYTINTQHIDSVERATNQLTVRLSNDECLSVSRRKLASVRARLWQHIQ